MIGNGVIIMAIKEAEQRKEDDELTKLKRKCDNLQVRLNGQLMKIMTLEARLSSEVKRSCEFESQLKMAEAKLKAVIESDDLEEAKLAAY